MRKYRDKLEIIFDILQAIKNGAKKTHVMYRANLSYKVLILYLEEVMNADLVVLGDKDTYILTKRGEEFLSRCSTYFSLRGDIESGIQRVNNEETDLKRILSSKENKTTKQSH